MTANLVSCFATFPDQIGESAPDDYHSFIFSFSAQHYRTRVDMAGFTGCQRVLDAGSGYGQWAVVLAAANTEVIAVDRNPFMVEMTRRFATHCGLDNLICSAGALPDLAFPDGHFDAIWCWGLFMFLNREKTLKEFNRLLRPGGRLLVGCANGRGRWLYKLFKALNPLAFDRSNLKAAWQTLLSGGTVNAEPYNFTTRRQCRQLCAAFGFDLLAADFDGYVDVAGQNRRLPMFTPYFAFMENNIEFLAIKANQA